MFVQLNLIISLSILVLYLYFFPRAQNRRNLYNPSFKKIDKILMLYYKNYFSKFSSLGDFPGLDSVYKDMAYSLEKKGIKRELLLEYSKKGKIKNSNWVFSIISLLISFMGATELDKLLKVSNTVSEIYNEHKEDGIVKYLGGFFKSGTWSTTTLVVFGGIVFIISISLMLFFVRADNHKSIVDFGFAKQKTLIAEDLCIYFPKGFEEANKSELGCYLDFLDFSILKNKEGYRIWIPKCFRNSEFKDSVVLKTGAENKIVVTKNGKDLTFYFKANGEDWILERAEEGQTTITDEDLTALKNVFRILFAYANLKEKKNGIWKWPDLVAEKIREIECNWFRVTVGTLAIIFLFAILLVFTGVIIFSIITGVIYIFIVLYLCWLISTWLLRNYF